MHYKRSVNYMHGSACINLSLCWKCCSNRHSFLQARRSLCSDYLDLGFTCWKCECWQFPAWWDKLCVIAFKHSCRATVAPQTVSCTTGRAEGAPKNPSLRRTYIPVRCCCSGYIWHIYPCCISSVNHHKSAKPWPVCTSQEPAADTGKFPWVRTWGLTLDCFIPGISNITGLILVSHPTIRRAGLEITAHLPFRQRGAPPVGKDLLKGENCTTPSSPLKAMACTACIPFFSVLPAWIFVLILTKCMELQQNSPRHRDKRKSIMFLTLPEGKCLTYRRSITATCQISHPVLVVTWICGMS